MDVQMWQRFELMCTIPKNDKIKPNNGKQVDLYSLDSRIIKKRVRLEILSIN